MTIGCVHAVSMAGNFFSPGPGLDFDEMILART
jgi:hypothetical protein